MSTAVSAISYQPAIEPPSARLAGWMNRNIWALGDQILISAANFITMVLAARSMPKTEFGSFTLIYSALLLANVLQSTLITQAQNAFPVADYNAAHIIVAWVGENLLDPVLIGVTQEHSAGFTPDFAEALASFPDGRRVDDGQKLFNVVGDERVKESLVVVLQIAHEAVFAEGGAALVERELAALALIFKASDMRGQQTVKPEGVAFLFSKGGALVKARIQQQVKARKASSD